MQKAQKISFHLSKWNFIKKIERKFPTTSVCFGWSACATCAL